MGGEEAAFAVRALAKLTGKVEEENAADAWFEARKHVVRQSGSFAEAARSIDHAVQVAAHLGASQERVNEFVKQCQLIAVELKWGLSSVAEAATLLGSLSSAARESLAAPMQHALDEAVVADLTGRLKDCTTPSQAQVALAQWRSHCGASAKVQLSTGPLEALALKWAQPALSSWNASKPDTEQCLSAAVALQALQTLGIPPNKKSMLAPLKLNFGSAQVWWAGWASAVGRCASLPLWPGLWELLTLISKAGPQIPVWVPPLVSLWAATTLDRALGEKPLSFTPTSYLQVLLLSIVLGGGQCVPPAATASLVLGLPDLTPSDRGAPARAFVRHAAKMLESADPIDAAYSQLHMPEVARHQGTRMALLLSPLTGTGTTLASSSSTAAASAVSSSAPEERVTAPLRPALRLLPHARPRLTQASASSSSQADDDDSDSGGASTVSGARPQAAASSLLQRLGSQFW